MRFFLLALMLVCPSAVMAVEVKFNPSELELGVGEVGEIEVFLSDVEQPIGAISGSLLVNSDEVLIDSIQTNNSFVSWWIEEPKALDNSVSFVGMVPHGFSGTLRSSHHSPNEGILFTLSVRGIATSTAVVSSEEFEAYTSSDAPEKILIEEGEVSVSVFGNSQAVESDISRTDITPPRFIEVNIVNEEYLFGGAPSLVFRTEDSESDVWYVEFGTDAGDWERITSPYNLSPHLDEELGMIKVVDKAGNSTTTTISLPSQEKTVLWSFAWWQIFVLISVIYVLFTIYRKNSSNRVSV